MTGKDNLSRLWRSIIEFDMLQPEDKVLIGLSGGKDSMLLTALLHQAQQCTPFPFHLACITVNTSFTENFDEIPYRQFAGKYQLNWYREDISVPRLIKDNTSPCYSCAYFRRAVINRKAKELGFNKVALAHHHDDAVETYLMNILTSGQQKTFLPVTKLSRSGITVIRPLLYYREYEITDIVAKMGLIPVKNPCPYNGNTTRQKIKQLITDWSGNYPDLYQHLATAMRCQTKTELWPVKLTKEEIINRFRNFWKGKE